MRYPQASNRMDRIGKLDRTTKVGQQVAAMDRFMVCCPVSEEQELLHVALDPALSRVRLP